MGRAHPTRTSISSVRMTRTVMTVRFVAWGTKGVGFLWKGFGTAAPHPAFGHPLPGERGRGAFLRNSVGLMGRAHPTRTSISSVRMTRTVMTVRFVAGGRRAPGSFCCVGDEGRRVPLERLWYGGPSPGLRPPSPGGEGSRSVPSEFGGADGPCPPYKNLDFIGEDDANRHDGSFCRAGDEGRRVCFVAWGTKGAGFVFVGPPWGD